MNRSRFSLPLAIAAWSVLSLARADSPSFMPVSANQLEVKSIAKHEARDSEEAEAGGPRIKVARGNQVFQFKRGDGTRVTVIDGKRSEANRNNSKVSASLWSFDDGKTWTWREGPPDDAANFGPGTVSEEAAIQFRDNGEILSIAATSLGMKRNVAGNESFFREHPNLVGVRERHYLNQRRSTDGWATARRECAPLDTPDAALLTGDNGGSSPGFLMHHGIVELPNGDLLATMYGNNTEDQTDDNRSAGYPPPFGMHKSRVIVVRSSDRGRTWGRERVVACRWMSGRDGGESASTSGNMRVPAVTQEGFNEASLVFAPNGDLLCLMRSGGRLSTPTAPIYSTPLYQSRSTDSGETWSDPVQIAPFGVNPNAVALENGVLVASYSRPGGWIMFSTDNGHTWKGHRQLTTSDAYTGLLTTGKNEFVVYYSEGGTMHGETFRVDNHAPDVRKQRYDAAHRPRRLVFHSDGVAMNPAHAYHEPTPSVIPHLPGTQTDACSYSLIHQFPVVRLYRSKAGQEWPPGITEKLFGNGPDGLDGYISFCRKHGYEAFWAMRTNDTHDATNDAHGQQRWDSNRWKQSHPELLFGTRDTPPPPFGNWTAFDYAQSPVRDKVFEVVAEVARNYAVDGVLLDFFRHLPTFKSTAWGRKEATDEERAALTALMRRLRDLRDTRGRESGRPVLLAVRTPDTFEYSRALGLDLEQWMKEGLIDVWITSGYFRLQEWDDIVALAHGHGIPVWASMDESRAKGRDNRNSLEAYRARIMNARRAGVDAVWMFNYFHFPQSPEFQLLKEAGSIETLAFTDKVYVPDDLGPGYARLYLADGLRYVRRPKVFAPAEPETLKAGQTREVGLRVGDDLRSVGAHGWVATATLRLQADTVDLQIQLNRQPLAQTASRDGWTDFAVEPSLLKLGVNSVTIRLDGNAAGDALLKDLQLTISYHRK